MRAKDGVNSLASMFVKHDLVDVCATAIAVGIEIYKTNPVWADGVADWVAMDLPDEVVKFMEDNPIDRE